MLFILLRLLLLPYIVFGMLYSNFYLFQAIFLLCWFILDLLLFRSVLLISMYLKDFQLFSYYWFLESCCCGQKLLGVISIFLNLLTCLWPIIWSILENVHVCLRRIVCFLALGWNVLYFSVWFFWSNVWFMPCFFFCCCCCWFFLDDLSLTKTGVGKSPTNIVSFSLQVC